MTKRIVIWSLVILGLLLIVLAIIFGPYIALTLALLFGRKEDDFDAEKYRGYICIDSNLACISASEESANAYITFSGGRSYDFTYRKAEDVSDDQFIVVAMRNSSPLSMKEKYVFQNPENPVDVWTDWTVKEIQEYYLDINQLPDSVLEEHDPPKTPTGIDALLEPIVPDSAGDYRIDHYGDAYDFLYKNPEGASGLRVSISEKQYYDSRVEKFLNYEEELVGQDQLTVTWVSERNAMVYTWVAYGRSHQHILYTVSANETIYYVEEEYADAESGVLDALYIWFEYQGEYIYIYVNDPEERPSVEWITSFAVKPYER